MSIFVLRVLCDGYYYFDDTIAGRFFELTKMEDTAEHTALRFLTLGLRYVGIDSIKVRV